MIRITTYDSSKQSSTSGQKDIKVSQAVTQTVELLLKNFKEFVIVKKIELKALVFTCLFGALAHGMEPGTGDIAQPTPLSTRSIYSQRSLKYLLVYLIKGWDCFKDLTDNQILEKLDRLPKEFIESFELVSVLEKCYTNDEKKLLLACMLDEVDELDESLQAVKQELFPKIIELKHAQLLSLAGKHLDVKAHFPEFFDEERKALLLRGLIFPRAICPLLYFAIMSKDHASINLLLELGANLNEEDEMVSPLMAAMEAENIELMRLLLERGANPNIKIYAHKSLLHKAAQCNFEQAALLLLKHGADVNAKDDKGATALHEAILWASEQVIAVLLNCEGIQVDEIEAREQTTPLQLCLKRYFFKTRLKSLPRSPGMFSISTIERMIVSLLDHGATINARDSHGSTTLMYASFFGVETIVKLLLSLGADARITNNSGESALSIAQDKGHAQIIALLEQH